MNESWIRIIFLLHVATTLFMVGVIWFVQVVHYPLFSRTGRSEFPAYSTAHAQLTAWVVGAPMLIELFTALLLLWSSPSGIPRSLWEIGLALLGTIWLSTLLMQVPSHTRLSTGFDPGVQKYLVSTNWIRTIAWSLRGLLLLWIAWWILK